MTALIGGAQVVLAVVLIAAAGGKVIRGREMAGALRLSRVPGAAALSVVVPILELGLGILLLVARGAALRMTFAATVLLLVTFTGWLVYVRAKDLKIRCGCFGAASKEVTNLTLVRNVMFIALGVAGAVATAAATSPLPESSVYWLMAVGSIAVTILLAAAFNQVRSHLVLSLETMKRRRDIASGIEV